MLRDPRCLESRTNRGRPAETPWRLALVTVLQFAEGLSDRQAADAVRGRIDWKYALGLELTDPGFDFSVLCEFRSRLLAGDAGASAAGGDAPDLQGPRTGQGPHQATHRLDPRPGRHPHAQPPGTGRRDAPRHAEQPGDRGARSGCGRGSRPSGSTATPTGSRSRACPRVRRPATPTARPSAPTASDCSTPSTARPRREWLGEVPAVEILRRVWLAQFYLDEGRVRWRKAE